MLHVGTSCLFSFPPGPPRLVPLLFYSLSLLDTTANELLEYFLVVPRPLYQSPAKILFFLFYRITVCDFLAGIVAQNVVQEDFVPT